MIDNTVPPWTDVSGYYGSKTRASFVQKQICLPRVNVDHRAVKVAFNGKTFYLVQRLQVLVKGREMTPKAHIYHSC
jgi:hypothetical protein